MTKRIPGKYDHLKTMVAKQEEEHRKNSKSSKLPAIFIGIILFTGLLMWGGLLVDRPGHDMDYDPKTAELWNEETPVQVDLVIYSDPGCECCHVYEDYLIANDFSTSMIYPDKLSDIKDYQGIPKEQRSCHTIKAGEYFIEGHVPLEAITKLLQNQPDIDGISLAGMPSGSPGMPGEKTDTFEIYSIKDGEVQGLFMSI